MSTWAVIPIKSPPDRKSRLAPALDPAAREALVAAMAAHVAARAGEAPGVDRVAFIAASGVGLPPAVERLPEPFGGLDAAVGRALAAALAGRAARLIVIAGDLPLVEADEIARLAAVPPDTIALAPDRHGAGTNAISLPLPAAAGFAFAFGAGSLGRHRAEAARLGLVTAEIVSEGLARDIDEPGDLADAAGLLD